MSIPLRAFGKTGVQISALGLGGHHLGGAKDEKTAIGNCPPRLDALNGYIKSLSAVSKKAISPDQAQRLIGQAKVITGCVR